MSSFSTSQDIFVEYCDNIIGDTMIGKAIKKMRKDSNYNQEYISKQINVGRTTLSDYEREKTAINFDLIEKIADCCNYEIIFKNKTTNETWNTKDLKRKDI